LRIRADETSPASFCKLLGEDSQRLIYRGTIWREVSLTMTVRAQRDAGPSSIANANPQNVMNVKKAGIGAIGPAGVALTFAVGPFKNSDANLLVTSIARPYRCVPLAIVAAPKARIYWKVIKAVIAYGVAVCGQGQNIDDAGPIPKHCRDRWR